MKYKVCSQTRSYGVYTKASTAVTVAKVIQEDRRHKNVRILEVVG